jgi:hypothetical protein
MDVSPQKFIAKIYRENATPQNLGLYIVRACAIEMHIEISQACENLQEKYRGPLSEQPLGADFLPACAGEMHMDIAQRHF